ncbi:MAG: leucine-rich repeat protein [Paludibacteraceae bacterium]|nr:leucine-rich repeat protein [Paludibacteraceae bacterium]
MYIGGSGDMPEVAYKDIPWNRYKNVITEIIIESKDITSVCDSAFYDFEQLKSVSYPENSALKKIGESAFEGCMRLTEIAIPDNCTEIGARCFNDCWGATSLTLSKNMTAIPEEAFYGCSNLTEIVIPDNITEIGKGCFTHCASAASLTLSKNITVIPEDAFYNCVSLSEMTLPEGVTAIEAAAFTFCRLTELVLPESLTSIGNGAFAGSMLLTKVRLPKAIVFIDEIAFSECPFLADVECPALTPPALGADAFLNIKQDAKLHIYRPFVDAYAATQWADWFTIVGSLGGCKVTAASSDETKGEVSITFDKEDILGEKDGVFIVRENAKAHLTATVTGGNTKFVSRNDDAEDNTDLERDITVTSDFDFVALFAPVYCTVTYYDWNGDELYKEVVNNGEDAKGMETDPTREGYTFIGWSKPLTNITSDMNVVAQYKKKDPTALEYTEADPNANGADPNPHTTAARKLLRNGTLLIDRHGITYTPNGHRLN